MSVRLDPSSVAVATYGVAATPLITWVLLACSAVPRASGRMYLLLWSGFQHSNGWQTD